MWKVLHTKCQQTWKPKRQEVAVLRPSWGGRKEKAVSLWDGTYTSRHGWFWKAKDISTLKLEGASCEKLYSCCKLDYWFRGFARTPTPPPPPPHSAVFKYPVKMKQFGLKLFHFHWIFKKKIDKISKPTPSFTHLNPLSRNLEPPPPPPHTHTL